MSDEITINAFLSFTNGVRSDEFGETGLTFDMSGTDYVRKTQSVGTSEEALNIGEITTPGYILIRNRDATNFVSLRAATGGANCVKIKAGEIALFRLASTAPFVIADTSSVEIEYLLIED